MANDVSANPMILDTPGVDILFPSRVKVKSITFCDYSSQASQVILQGIDGKIKFSSTGQVDLSPVNVHDLGWFNGLVLPTLDDGRLLVYVE